MIDTTEICNNTMFSNDIADVDSINIELVNDDDDDDDDNNDYDDELGTIRTTIQIFLQQERNIYYNTSFPFNNNNNNWIQDLSKLTNNSSKNITTTNTTSERSTAGSTATTATTTKTTETATVVIDWFHYRTVMIQWLVDIVSYWDMTNSSSTIEFTINYIDRCMMSIVQQLLQQQKDDYQQQSQKVNNNNPLTLLNILSNFALNTNTFQFVCITCFYIACKVNEPICLDINAIYKLSKCICTIEQIKNMEHIILQSLLQWNVHPPTTESYIHYYLQYISLQQKQQQEQQQQQHDCYIDYDTIMQTATDVCSSIIQKSNQIIGSNTIKPSILAYCAIVHTLEQYNNNSSISLSSINNVKDLLFSLLLLSVENDNNEKQLMYNNIEKVQYQVTSFLMNNKCSNNMNNASLIIVDAEVINDDDDEIIVVNEFEIINVNDNSDNNNNNSDRKNNNNDNLSLSTTTISTVDIQLLQQQQQQQQHSPCCTTNVSDVYINNNEKEQQQQQHQQINNNENYSYCNVHDNDNEILVVVLGELIIED